MNERLTLNTDMEFIRYLKQNGGETMKKCFQCATCTVTCSLSPESYAFPRKEMLRAGWGLKEELISDPDIWLCHGCMDCSEQCPRGARPGDLMSALRNYIYKNFAFPRFMGVALNSPKHLIWLLLIPVLFISGLILISHNGDLSHLFTMQASVLQYKEFINHGPLEMLFIGGNVLIFSFAVIGYNRYWKNLNKGSLSEPTTGILKAAWKVKTDFLFHRKFKSCPENSTRYYGHIYIFYGFLGTIIATAIVVLNEFKLLGGEFLPYPMYLMHPLKIFGLLSGFFLVTGALLFIMRRYKSEANEGKSIYNDWLFLWVLWGVAFTGMLSVFARLTAITEIAYPVYFIHLVLVFFLLWYMPYSKFAHMFYRFMGLLYLEMHKRENKAEIFINENIKTNILVRELTEANEQLH